MVNCGCRASVKKKTANRWTQVMWTVWKPSWGKLYDLVIVKLEYCVLRPFVCVGGGGKVGGGSRESYMVSYITAVVRYMQVIVTGLVCRTMDFPEK